MPEIVKREAHGTSDCARVFKGLSWRGVRGWRPNGHIACTSERSGPGICPSASQHQCDVPEKGRRKVGRSLGVYCYRLLSHTACWIEEVPNLRLGRVSASPTVSALYVCLQGARYDGGGERAPHVS